MLTLGCRATAPMHVWQPPELESAVAKRVVIAGVDGPSDIAGPLIEQLIRQSPRDRGRELQLSTVAQLKAAAGDDEASETIRLVSAVEDLPTGIVPSDVSLLPLARSQGYDLLLQGVVSGRRDPRHPHTRVDDKSSSDDAKSPEHLTVSWRLTDTSGRQAPLGRPINVRLDDAMQRYPDLAFIGDPKTALLAAAARDTNRLIIPFTRRDDVPLSVPYLLPGSREVRRGNALAMAGRWKEAQEIWQDVVDGNPIQVSALVNLALAAAARQDFSTAKKLARQAIRRAPSRLAQETLVWIELRQREYHKAFGLPTPPEGWYVTREDLPL